MGKLTDVAGRCARTGAAALNRVKLLLAGIVATFIGLYDVITAGGIDLDGLLKPLIGDRIDVGRVLSTVALLVVILRFCMQSGMFKSTNKNGLDNPDEPDLTTPTK